MGRQENVSIFEETRKFCKTNPVVANAIKLSNDFQEVFLEDDPVLPTPKAKSEAVKIIVSKKRSFEAARQYVGDGTCVLTFASSTNPGGVMRGSTAQDEYYPVRLMAKYKLEVLPTPEEFEKMAWSHFEDMRIKVKSITTRNRINQSEFRALYENMEDFIGYIPDIIIGERMQLMYNDYLYVLEK